jgi:hypothetical protein
MTTLPRIFAAATFLAAPYHMTMTFQDGSVELCGVESFNYNGSDIAVQVTTCEPDVIFRNGFE